MGIMEKMRLDGKASFVTGGARGIGRQIGRRAGGSGEAMSHWWILTLQKQKRRPEKLQSKRTQAARLCRRKSIHDGDDCANVWQIECGLLQCRNLYEHPLRGNDLRAVEESH